MTPLDRVLDVLTSLECKPRHSGTGWSAKCPAHPDKAPSLSVSEGADGKALLNCHAGCRHDDVAKALGLTEKDLFPPPDAPPPKAQLVATYPYQDENGVVLYEALRYSPKTFRQRKPVPGGYEWSLNGVRRVPFRLPELIANVHEGETVFIVEGEKDVLAMTSKGFCATCNAGGADAKEDKAAGTWHPGDGSKWRDDFAHYFKGADVVILPDNDGAGRAHAERVRRSLERQAKRIRVVELPGLPEKGDVSDFFAAGHTAQELQALVDAPAPEAAPAGPAPVYDVPGILSRSSAGLARYSTSLLALDELLRPRANPTLAGLLPGRVVALNGAPGAGKSLLADQLAFAMARHGFRVVMLVDDEPREDAAERVGQLLGFRHAELNPEYPGTIVSLRETLADPEKGLDISILPDEEAEGPRPTIEDAAALLLSVQNERGHVLVIDSLHASLSKAEKDGDIPRVQIETRMAAIKHLRRQGVLVIFTSEVNRASYASKDPSQRVAALASGAEGRSIEYGSDLILFLSSSTNSLTQIEVPKNRIGRKKGAFLVRLNEARARFETEDPAVAEAQAKDAQDAVLMAIEDRVVGLLDELGVPCSTATIERENLGGRGGRDLVRQALLSGVKKGKFTRRPHKPGEGRGGGFVFELPSPVVPK